MQADRGLTPYDTGARLEPRLWRPVPGDDDSYGRVDFENDESSTELTIYVERNEDGGYRICVDQHADVELELVTSG